VADSPRAIASLPTVLILVLAGASRDTVYLR